MSYRCAICGCPALEIVDGFGELVRVGSDSSPFPPGGKLGQCQECMTVQKPIDDAFRQDCETIYSSYVMYAQSSEASEPKVFEGGQEGRSLHLLRKVGKTIRLPRQGRILDFGCGNGSFLRAFSKTRPVWQLAGLELDDRHRSAVEAIAGCEGLYTGDLASIPGRFDVISMMHALEHIENPVTLLREIGSRLSPGGIVVIQLPLWEKNPFDLVVADHCLHFDRRSILNTLQLAGLHPLLVSDRVISRELTVIAGNDHDAATIDECSDSCSLDPVLFWLETVRGELEKLGAEEAELGIFGTGNGAMWASGVAKNVAFYVDEDPTRVGIHALTGKPVYPPANIPSKGTVYISLPPSVADLVLKRVNAYPAIWVAPPPLEGCV